MGQNWKNSISVFGAKIQMFWKCWIIGFWRENLKDIINDFFSICKIYLKIGAKISFEFSRQKLAKNLQSRILARIFKIFFFFAWKIPKIPELWSEYLNGNLGTWFPHNVAVCSQNTNLTYFCICWIKWTKNCCFTFFLAPILMWLGILYTLEIYGSLISLLNNQG